MSRNESLRIKIPPQEDRLKWNLGENDSVEETCGFTTEELFEIVQRYCDQAEYRKASQNKRNARIKALTAAAQAKADAAGLSLEDYIAAGQE